MSLIRRLRHPLNFKTPLSHTSREAIQRSDFSKTFHNVTASKEMNAAIAPALKNVTKALSTLKNQGHGIESLTTTIATSIKRQRPAYEINNQGKLELSDWFMNLFPETAREPVRQLMEAIGNLAYSCVLKEDGSYQDDLIAYLQPIINQSQLDNLTNANFPDVRSQLVSNAATIVTHAYIQPLIASNKAAATLLSTLTQAMETALPHLIKMKLYLNESKETRALVRTVKAHATVPTLRKLAIIDYSMPPTENKLRKAIEDNDVAQLSRVLNATKPARNISAMFTGAGEDLLHALSNWTPGDWDNFSSQVQDKLQTDSMCVLKEDGSIGLAEWATLVTNPKLPHKAYQPLIRYASLLCDVSFAAIIDRHGEYREDFLQYISQYLGIEREDREIHGEDLLKEAIAKFGPEEARHQFVSGASAYLTTLYTSTLADPENPFRSSFFQKLALNTANHLIAPYLEEQFAIIAENAKLNAATFQTACANYISSLEHKLKSHKSDSLQYQIILDSLSSVKLLQNGFNKIPNPTHKQIDNCLDELEAIRSIAVLQKACEDGLKKSYADILKQISICIHHLKTKLNDANKKLSTIIDPLMQSPYLETIETVSEEIKNWQDLLNNKAVTPITVLALLEYVSGRYSDNKDVYANNKTLQRAVANYTDIINLYATITPGRAASLRMQFFEKKFASGAHHHDAFSSAARTELARYHHTQEQRIERDQKQSAAILKQMHTKKSNVKETIATLQNACKKSIRLVIEDMAEERDALSLTISRIPDNLLQLDSDADKTRRLQDQCDNLNARVIALRQLLANKTLDPQAIVQHLGSTSEANPQSYQRITNLPEVIATCNALSLLYDAGYVKDIAALKQECFDWQTDLYRDLEEELHKVLRHLEQEQKHLLTALATQHKTGVRAPVDSDQKKALASEIESLKQLLSAHQKPTDSKSATPLITYLDQLAQNQIFSSYFENTTIQHKREQYAFLQTLSKTLNGTNPAFDRLFAFKAFHEDSVTQNVLYGKKDSRANQFLRAISRILLGIFPAIQHGMRMHTMQFWKKHQDVFKSRVKKHIGHIPNKPPRA